jgi:hypothetical protein
MRVRNIPPLMHEVNTDLQRINACLGSAFNGLREDEYGQECLFTSQHKNSKPAEFLSDLHRAYLQVILMKDVLTDFIVLARKYQPELNAPEPPMA